MWKMHWPEVLKGLIHVRWEMWRPRLIVHERFETHVRWILRGLGTAGLLTSFVTLGPIGGFLLSLVILGVEQFLEKAVLRYTTIVLTPLPDFSFNMKDLTGMAYARPANPEPGLLPCVGFTFAAKELAARFFEVLRKWNYGEQEDKEDNIKLSFVWPKNDPGYYVCLYPSFSRKGVEQTFEEVEAARKNTHPKKEQHGLIVVWTIRKYMRGTTHLQDFLNRHSPGEPYWLYAFLRPEGSQDMEMLYDVKPILKWHYRVLKEGELRKADPERQMMRRKS